MISFAARYDGARTLVKKIDRVTTTNNALEDADATTSDDSKGLRRHLATLKEALFKGYFGPLTLAYALGLAIAFIVVSITMSQPALLYLAPICLAAIFFLGLKRRELAELWQGPRSMWKANKLISVASRVPSMREEQARAETGNLAETTSVA